jgi:HK97 gp10 family phage protein
MANLVELKVTGIDGVLDLLKKLPPEVVSKRGGPVRAALRKGALVIQQQEKANLQAVLNGTNDEGERLSTGLLMDNIIVSRGKAPTGGKGERFLVRVKRKVYPRPNNEGGDTTTLKIARLKEYGSSKQPAKSFIRTAAAMKAQEAVNVTTTELVKRLNAIVKKLARK